MFQNNSANEWSDKRTSASEEAPPENLHSLFLSQSFQLRMGLETSPVAFELICSDIEPLLIELLHAAYVFDIIQYVNTSNVGLQHFKQTLNFAAADLTCSLENVAAPTCLLELETEEKQSVVIQTERGHPRVNLLSPHLHCRLGHFWRRSCIEDTLGVFSPCPRVFVLIPSH